MMSTHAETPLAADDQQLRRAAPRVVVLGNYNDVQYRKLESAAPEAAIVSVVDLGQAESLFSEVEVVAGTVPEALLSRLPKLKWVHTWAAGPDSDLHPGMRASDVVLTSSAGNGAIPLAEHAMMLALMLNRNYPRWAKAQSERKWDRFVHGELAGQTMGIFGVGNSGEDLARKAKAFHMRVLGLRRNPDKSVDGVDQMYSLEQLHEFLAQCDVVVVTAPLTEETRGAIDEASLRVMKTSAFLIVFSRGGIVDDAALAEALREGRLAGAGLDAHGQEPLPSDSPFWTLPSTIVTPHNGATTARTAERGFEIFAENLRRYVRDEPLINVVDKARGY